MMMQKELDPGAGISSVALALTGLGVFLTGVGAGVTLALLFAPLSGSDTRRMIGRTVANSENWVKDKALAAEDYLHAQGQRVRNRAEGVAEAMGRN